nr:MAG TPA: DNA primase/helicase [Caudoviricetes sp.]
MLNPAVSNLIKEMKKACPFCGGSAHLWRWGRKFDKTSRQYAVKCYRCMTHSEPSEDPKQAVINWYNENFSEFQRNANKKLKKNEAHEDGALAIIYRILESTSGEFRFKYLRYLTTDKDDMKYERFKQDMESCERSLISTIEFWQPAVDGKSAVEKVKADIRAERGVQP